MNLNFSAKIIGLFGLCKYGPTYQSFYSKLQPNLPLNFMFEMSFRKINRQPSNDLEFNH